MKITALPRILALSALLFTSADAAEVTLSACPQAVRDTITANQKKGRIDEINRSGDRYLVEIDLSKHHDLDLVINADGKLLKSVEDVSLSKVPRPVKNSILKLQGNGGRVDDLKIERAGTRVVYRVEIEFPGKPEIKAKLTETGLVLKRSR